MTFKAADVKRAVGAAIDIARKRGVDVGPIEAKIAPDGEIVVRIEPGARIAPLSRHAQAKALSEALAEKRRRRGPKGS